MAPTSATPANHLRYFIGPSFRARSVIALSRARQGVGVRHPLPAPAPTSTFDGRASRSDSPRGPECSHLQPRGSGAEDLPRYLSARIALERRSGVAVGVQRDGDRAVPGLLLD